MTNLFQILLILFKFFFKVILLQDFLEKIEKLSVDNKVSK